MARIKIDGRVHRFSAIDDPGYPTMPRVQMDDGALYYLAADRDAATVALREYYRDLADAIPDQFTRWVGTRRLIDAADTGTLNALLDELAQEGWGEPLPVTRAGRIADDLGFVPTLAFAA